MISNNFDHFSFSSSIVPKAEAYIKSNDRQSLKNLLETHVQLAVAPMSVSFNSIEPLYKLAIDCGMDHIAIDLYESSPFEVKQYICRFYFNELTIYTDFLGAAVMGRRYELVERLLEFEDDKAFDVNGVKNTNNIFTNFYHISNKREDIYFSNYDPYGKYVSSPLMLAILIGDLKMCKLLKQRGAYFNIENDNCLFHLNNCKDQDAKNDIYNFFKLEEE